MPRRPADSTIGTPERGANRNMTPAGWWALALILFASAVVDLVFFTGLYASDDLSYLRAAERLLNGGFRSNPALGEMRLTMVGWNALVSTLTGGNIQLVAASYIIWHQLLNACAFALGARLFRSGVGLLAAYLSALVPVHVISSTMVLPDLQMALWMGASLLAFQEACRCRTRDAAGTARVLLLLAGACVGLAYMTKESGLVALPFYLGFWLVSEFQHARKRGRAFPSWNAISHGACFAIGFFVIFVGESVALSILTGGPFMRLGWTVETIAPSRIERVQEIGFDPLVRWQRVTAILREGDFMPTTLTGLVVCGLVGFPLLIRRAWSLYLFPVWVFAYLTWGSMSLTQYVPPYIKTRYYIPLLPFLLIIACAVLWRLGSLVGGRVPHNRARRVLAGLAMTAIVVLPLHWLAIPNRLAGNSYRANLVRVAAQAVNTALAQSDRPVVLSSGVSRSLALLLESETSSRVILAHRLTRPMLEQIAEGGGCEYVEFAGTKMLHRPRFLGAPAPLDRLVYTVTREPCLPFGGKTLWGDALLGWSPDPDCAPFFQLGHHRFNVIGHSTFGHNALVSLKVEDSISGPRVAVQRDSHTAPIYDPLPVDQPVDRAVDVTVEHQSGIEFAKPFPELLVGIVRQHIRLIIAGISVHSDHTAIARHVHLEPRRQVVQELVMGEREPFHRPAEILVSLGQAGRQSGPVLRRADRLLRHPVSGHDVTVIVPLEKACIGQRLQAGQRL